MLQLRTKPRQDIPTKPSISLLFFSPEGGREEALDYVVIPHPSHVIIMCASSCGMSTALCSNLLDPLSPLGTGWGLWGKLEGHNNKLGSLQYWGALGSTPFNTHHRHPDSQNWWKTILPRVEESLKVSLGRPTVCLSHPFIQNHRYSIKMSQPLNIHIASLPGSKDNTDGRRRETNCGRDQKLVVLVSSPSSS